MNKFALIIGLALAAGTPAFPDDVSLTVQSGADVVSVPLVAQGNDVWGLSSNVSETLPDGNSFTILADETYLDSDPKVQYGLGVTNDDSSADGTFTSYTFTFTTPTTLTPGLYGVSASLAGSLTDGGSNGSTLKPSSTYPYVQQSLIGTDDAGVDLLNTAVSEPSDGGDSQGFSVPNASGVYNLATTANQISIVDNFQVSDNDSATLSGRFNVNVAPEPSSFALGLVCLIGFAGLVARFRTRSV